MAETRTLVAPQTLPGAYPTLQPGAGSRLITWVAYDVSNTDRVAIVENKTLILIHNLSGSAKTVTFVSSVDAYGRVGDITAYSVAGLGTAVFGPFKSAGWLTAGFLTITAEDANIQIANITLP